MVVMVIWGFLTGTGPSMGWSYSASRLVAMVIQVYTREITCSHNWFLLIGYLAFFWISVQQHGSRQMVYVFSKVGDAFFSI